MYLCIVNEDENEDVDDDEETPAKTGFGHSEFLPHSIHTLNDVKL